MEAFRNRRCDGLMASILDGLGLEGSVLDGLAEWPASTTRKEWFALTKQLIQETIADMDLDPHVWLKSRRRSSELACCDSQTGVKGRDAATPRVGDEADRQRRRLL